MSFLSKNIRTLLTARYTAVVAGLMLAYSGINLAFQYQYLRKQLDLNLKEDLEIIQEILVTNEVIINPLDRMSDHIPKPYERFVEIWSDSGEALYHSSAFHFEMKPPPPNPARYSAEPQFFSFQFPSGTPWRTIGVKVMTTNGVRIVRISMSEQHLYDQVWDIFRFMTYLTPIFLLIAVATGYFLARQALRPIDVLASQAQKIGAENLRTRLTPANQHDELGNLASVLNELLDRLQRSFQQLKNFTADASHELRTPLTAMRSVGEVGLQPGQSPEYYREVIGSMLEETGRLTHLVDSLLFLAKADADSVKLNRQEFDVIPFLEEAKESLLILAEEKGQTMEVSASGPLVISADKALLRRALLNLIDNAIKYTPVGGVIRLGVALLPGGLLRITVSDTGPGIPEEYREKIFDRFFRPDKDRSRETGGAGLGLAIVQWIVSVHNGAVGVESNAGGSTFHIDLPAPRLIPPSLPSGNL